LTHSERDPEREQRPRLDDCRTRGKARSQTYGTAEARSNNGRRDPSASHFNVPPQNQPLHCPQDKTDHGCVNGAEQDRVFGHKGSHRFTGGPANCSCC
jgi:hypothetical protein